MKLLLDSCVWGGAVEELRQAGHDVVWTGGWPANPGDREILRRAHEEDRVLVALDKDFGERAVVFGEAHRGIIRLVGIRARSQGAICLRVLARYRTDLEGGAIVTADPQRTRIRAPD